MENPYNYLYSTYVDCVAVASYEAFYAAAYRNLGMTWDMPQPDEHWVRETH